MAQSTSASVTPVTPDPNRPYRPPLVGTPDVTIQYISGQIQRTRASSGQEIIVLLTRFLEFATARPTGSMTYSMLEPPRWQNAEEGYPFELVIYGNNLPADLASTQQALRLLISGCPDMIFSNTMEGPSGESSIPNIFFTPGRVKFLQNLEIFDTPCGFGLKGNFMLRRSATRYYAYPFKVHIVKLSDQSLQLFHSHIAFSGDLEKLIDKMLEYWDLKLDRSMMGADYSSLSMNYDGEDVFLTRGNSVMNFLPNITTSMFSGLSTEAIVNCLKTLRFCTSESLIYALGKLEPNNQLRKAISTQVSGNTVRGADYHYPSPLDEEARREGFKTWLVSLLQQRSLGPRNLHEDPAMKWGLGYISELERSKQTVGVVENRISNAVGKEVYNKLVTPKSKLAVLDEYIARIEAQGLDFMHISEGRLELDFIEFAQEKGLPLPDEVINKEELVSKPEEKASMLLVEAGSSTKCDVKDNPAPIWGKVKVSAI